MADQKIGGEVIRQANDGGVFNTEPVVAANAIVGIVAAVGSILVIGGYVDSDQVDQLKSAAGQIVPAVFLIASIVAGIWGRMHAYSPKSAAIIAVTNAAAPAGAVPTLDPPP
jgi:fumarate reductase subunit D